MTNVLIVNSSLNGNAGNSNQLTKQFANRLTEQFNISHLDLMSEDLPHLTSEEMQAWMTPKEQRNKVQQDLASLSDRFVAQVNEADIIVVGMPMYNFGVPSVFKSWIDRIARAGVTFKYTEQGPVGLLEDKKVYVLAARGGMYQGTEKDSQTQYIKDVFSFIGLNDIEFVYAEGLAMGPDSYKAATTAANEKIIELTKQFAA